MPSELEQGILAVALAPIRLTTWMNTTRNDTTFSSEDHEVSETGT